MSVLVEQRRTKRAEPQPRFPRRWIDEAKETSPSPKPAHTLRPLFWWLLALVLACGGVALHGLWQAYREASQYGQQPMLRIEGTIETFGTTGAGTPLMTVTSITGEPCTVAVDANQTSVFQPGAVLGTAHLKPGQHVVMMYDTQLARTIQIVHQPRPW